MRNRKTSVKWHFLGHMCVLANTLLENHLPTTLPYEPSQFYEQNHLVYREGLGVIACVWNIDEDVAGVKRDVLDSWKYRVEAWIVSLFEQNPHVKDWLSLRTFFVLATLLLVYSRICIRIFFFKESLMRNS